MIEIDPQSAPPVTPPVVTTADRISNSAAVVRFETHSVGNFEVTFYTANDSTTPYLVSVLITIICVRSNDVVLCRMKCQSSAVSRQP